MDTELVLGILFIVLLFTNVISLAIVGYQRQELKNLKSRKHIEYFDEVP